MDPRFGLGADEARIAVERAAALWEGSLGRRLFVHDPAGGFPIRFTYDERQAAGQERRAAEREVGASFDSLEIRRAEVEALEARYIQTRAAYERDAEDLAARVASHNDTVRAWNARRDAPAEKLAALLATGETLGARGEELRARRAVVEALGLQGSDVRDAYDRRRLEHERLAGALRERFDPAVGEAAEYSEALRTDTERVTALAREIRVYRFDDAADLERIVAHELGHALGLPHTNEQGAIMSERYDLAGPDTRVASLAPADLELLRARCPHWFAPLAQDPRPAR